MAPRKLGESKASWVRRLAAAMVVSIGLLGAATGVALAHANLVRSAPAANAVLEAAPSELRLWFSEAPEPRFAELRLLDRAGQPVPAVGPARADAADRTLLVAALSPLPPGVYTVAWRVTSAVDGHVTAGSFAFAVGRDQALAGGMPTGLPGASTSGGEVPAVWAAGVRWLGYIGAALLAGAFAFAVLVLRPVLEAAGAGEVAIRAPARAGGSPAVLLTLAAVGWVVAVATALAGALVEAALAAGVGALGAFGLPLLTLLGGTRYGTLFWSRLLVLGLLGGLLVVGRRWLRQATRLPDWWLWTGLGLSGLLLLATSLGSHAAAGPAPVGQTIADWLHLAAMSVWIGGLPALLLALGYFQRLEEKLPHDMIGRLVGRFSQMAVVCLVAVAATGAYRAVFEVGDWANLLDTAYGTTLLIKLALLVPLLLLAGANLLLVKPRLGLADSGRWAGPAPALWLHRLRLAAGGELLIALALLLVTGVLANLPPGREAFGSGLVVRADAPDLRAVLVVSPGAAGLNSFDVYLRDGSGKAVADAEKVALIFTMVEHDMGQSEAVAQNAGDGHYVVQGGYLAMAGTWQAELLVRRPGRDDARATLLLRPRAPASAPATAAGLGSGLLPGLGLILGGLLLAFAGWQLGGERPWMRFAAFAAGIAVVALGLVAAL